MKNLLFLVVILLSLFSTNAFATHAYRSEYCSSKTLNLYYKGNYPVGGMYGISLINDKNEIIALPLYDVSETPTTLDEEVQVVFDEKSSTVIEKTPMTNDGSFDHEEWISEKTIEISLISDDASLKLGLKQGDQIEFRCEESTDYPSNTEVNQ